MICYFKINENHEFMLSFSHRCLDNIEAITYYAFTYPYTYTDLCNSLSFYEKQFPPPTELKGILNFHKSYKNFKFTSILFILNLLFRKK